MVSRMDRYNNSEGRSLKNRELYDRINEMDSYNNVESIKEIPNGSDIDIEVIKELVNSNEVQAPVYKQVKKNKVVKEEKNYDIKEILDKAKVDHVCNDKRYRSIKSTQYDILKRIKIDDIDDTEELTKIIDTMSMGSQYSDDLGLLDELKSNTMVGDASSIKKIIDETKEKSVMDNEETNNLDNIDNTFYSSRFSFTDNDFEDIRNLDKNNIKSNKLINIVILIVSILIVLAIVLIILKFAF